MEIWNWSAKSTLYWDISFLSIITSLSKEQFNLIDWEPYLDQIFPAFTRLYCIKPEVIDSYSAYFVDPSIHEVDEIFKTTRQSQGIEK